MVKWQESGLLRRLRRLAMTVQRRIAKKIPEDDLRGMGREFA